MDNSQAAGDLLAVILDVNPIAWAESAKSDQSSNGLSLQQALDAVLVFCNTHLALTYDNHLCFVAAGLSESPILYSSLINSSKDSATAAHRPLESVTTDPNSFQQFRYVNTQISEALEKMLSKDNDITQYTNVHLIGALSKTLCHIKRFSHIDATKPPCPPRILIISISPDSSSQHIPIMNSIFSAQKANIPIDVCKVHGEDTVFLQQASHLTSGLYYRIEDRAGLLQYLMVTYLPGRHARKMLNLPNQDQVDLRAACFCHRKIVDLGYVCSVCLSIHCTPRPVCVTCNSKFPFSSIKRLRPPSSGNSRASTPAASTPAG